jgi:DNA polymerase-4
MGPVSRTILHVDMDAFFVSVELLDRPELRGRPVVVGGTGDRGVVAAASYEARAHGIASAMPTARARRLCPRAVFLPADHGRYAPVSRRIVEILRSYTPLVEPLSLDEAFLDVSGARRALGDGAVIGRSIRARVLAEEGLTCSVGVATTKTVAKLASEAAKPRPGHAGPRYGHGVHVVPPGGEASFLRPLPARALWGVGPATLSRLERLGARTVGDIADLPEVALVGALGRAHGRLLGQLARGVDPRPVVPGQRARSIGHEETFPTDLDAPDDLRREVVRLADAVAWRLRREGRAARTVTLKVRFGDFRTVTRSVTPPVPVEDGPALAGAALGLLAGVDTAPGVRLLGVSGSGLVGAGTHQLSFDDVDRRRRHDVSGAVDAVRARFGEHAIGPATVVGRQRRRPGRRGGGRRGPGEGPSGAPPGK